MKKRIIFGLFALSLLVSCGKVNTKATIDRDCSGTYLTIKGLDYEVCNPDIISAYPEGSEINVKYKSVSECPVDSTAFICELYHVNYGTIEITEVK